ncbi:MAG TPA: dihydrolipoyllysine-residue succinyltransferase [Verrucomicrobiae bacterium]|jgi:2-oxoglutarate dehydrogenase E2 component (dihydrolipoamide succinyltransferase)|nr:dihydrolipoyllysine-residue succinyltransferase [Verrucomicrobiae bacterium]
MPIDLTVPTVGESITEVEIGQWLKAEGDTVQKDENVVALESEKATVDLPAPAAGVLTKILKKKGDKAAVGEIIAQIDAAGAAPKATESKPAEAKAAKSSKTAAAPAPPAAPAPAPEPVEEKAAPAPTPPPVKSSVPAPASGGREEEVVRMSPLRRTVAQRLVESKNTMAMLTTFNEVDMSAVIALRKQHQDAFVARHGVKLGFMSFFVRASIEALKAIPQLNASIRGTDIVYHNYFDISIAIGSDKGLVAPALRNAERLSFSEVEKAIADFAARAKANKLKPDELQSGTFTITNGGVYGSLLSTPIINPPQSGILGMHSIQERPIAVAGAVVIRPMMNIALSYDHRLVDGREAVTFLVRVKDMIENPARILLEI